MDALQNLVVWKRACRFTVDVYRLLANCSNKSFKDQLERSALSIASNIAEGYERESVRERARFLKIARGSTAEAWTQLLIGMEAGFISKADALEKANDARQISKMLFALLKHIEKAGCKSGGLRAKNKRVNPEPCVS